MVAASINGYLYQAVTVPLMKITTPAKKIRKGTDVASEPLLTASNSWSQPSTNMTKPTNFCMAVTWRSPSASSSCSSWRSSVLGFWSISILAAIRLEQLAQRQPLELVRRADPFPIHLFGPLLHPLEEHLEEGLAVVDQERHVVRPHLQDDGRAVQVSGAVPEAGIEEAGVVRAQFADGGFVGDHLRGIVRRHPDALLRQEDVELLRLQ